MKKLLLLFTILFIATQCYCQVTVTQSAFPQAGDTWIQYADYTDSGYIITAPSSMPQNWDYASVFILSDTEQLRYHTASAVPFSGEVPGATLGLGFGAYSEFYNSDTSGYYYTGDYSLSDSGSYYSAMVWSPSNLLLPVPFTYGSTRQYTSMAVVTGYDSIINSYSKQITIDEGAFTADAFGTITTPGYSNIPVLRLNDSYHEYDTTYIGHTAGTVDSLFDTSKTYYTTYYFVQNTSPYLLMQINYLPSSQFILSAFYITSTAPTAVSEVMGQQPFTNVYPNPAPATAIHFTINGSNARQLKIYNIAGQCVETENVTGINTLTLTNNLLMSGIYFYRITDNYGNIVGGKKFVVE